MMEDNATRIIGYVNAPFSIMEQLEQLDQQGNRKLEQRYKPTRPNRHL